MSDKSLREKIDWLVKQVKCLGSQIVVPEIDPVFIASPAGTIEQTDIDSWNNKLDAETDTLQSVATRGNITNLPIIVNKVESSEGFITNATKPIGINANNNITYGESNITTTQRVEGTFHIDVNKGQYGGRVFRVQNNEVDIFILPANVGNTGNSPRFPFINNANGDAMYAKQVVAKVDGTFGIIDKNEIVSWIDLPLNNSSKYSSSSYVKYRVKNNTLCIHGFLTFNAGTTFSASEIICDLPLSVSPDFIVPNNSFMLPVQGGIINDVGVNQLIIEYRPTYSTYRIIYAQAVTQSGFNMGTSFYTEIKL